ncbi:MAG: hypothetical protein KA297_07740 [Kofleriaceae bacterium]|jgi:cytoskeletal protein CcmA (bactofilin family)|nr:hypothetical protein [Kofleriaceae bacterium]MBP6836015.1 hypothetical protein [Kofleriaceae bacterium]
MHNTQTTSTLLVVLLAATAGACAGPAPTVGVANQALCPASDLLAQAVCVCGDLVTDGALRVGDGAPGNADLGVAGSLHLSGAVDVDGTVRALGSVDLPGSMSTSALLSNGDLDVSGSLDVAGDTHVAGDLVVSGSALIGQELQVGGSEEVTGSAEASVRAPFAAPIAPPCGCDEAQLFDVAGAVAAAAASSGGAESWSVDGAYEVTLATGSYYLTSATLNGATSVTVDGAVALFIDGDLMNAGATEWILSDGASLDLFVAGNLDVAGALEIGDAAHADAVRVYVGGDADATVDLSGSTTLYGSLYAPRAAVTFTGSGQLAGALFTRNLDVSGSLTVSSGAATTPPPSCQQPPSEPPAGGTAPGTEVVQ